MFKITIEEIKTVNKILKGAWGIVGTKEAENVYGYLPDREGESVEYREILTQTVDTIDLPKVIRAINNFD